jgi:ubiquinone/menaquinone biosynthesis C-methylase UbiE
MSIPYRETASDLQTRIDIHHTYGGKDIDAWMLELLALSPGSRILDVGCGAGKQCLAFYRALKGNAEITGGDVSKELIDEAERIRVREGAAIRYLPLDFNVPFAFPDASFDLVSCCFAIYYAEDPGFTFREVHRILRQGGRFISTGPLPENKQLFYQVIQEATGRAIPPMPGSSRYSSVILRALQNQFRKVDVHRFENPLRFETAEPFLAYTRASLSEDRKLWSGLFHGPDDFERVMAQIESVARKQLSESGALVMTKVVGGFLAWK